MVAFEFLGGKIKEQFGPPNIFYERPSGPLKKKRFQKRQISIVYEDVLKSKVSI